MDIEVSYGEELDYGEDRGSYTTISDYEYIQLWLTTFRFTAWERSQPPADAP